MQRSITSGGVKRTILLFIIFELGLVPSVILSYPDKIFNYLVSYNLGIVIFFIFHVKNCRILSLSKLGSIGFSFFLGSKLLIDIVLKFVELNVYLEWILEFILAVLFATTITRFIEKPIDKWEKIIEEKFN